MNIAATTLDVPGIIAEAGEQVLLTFDKHQDNRLVFHNYAHTYQVVQRTLELCNKTGADPETTEITALAATFLHTGYLFDYNNYASYSLDQVQRFMALRNYAEANQRKVLRCLQTITAKNTPVTLEEKILADAVSTVWLAAFETRSPLLKIERELMQGHTFSRLQWAKLQFQSLLELRLYTHYAKTTFEPVLGQCIQMQSAAIQKLERNAAAPPPERLFQGLDDAPIRAVQTFFRSNYRNHINLSAIADNKANIMISVNSILISVLISILSYRNMADTTPQVVLPAVIFLVTGLASLIFAVLSARPKVTSLNNRNMQLTEKQRNIVFFGNFVTLEAEEYEEAMDAMFRDGELLYGNLVRDLYHLGKVLDKKYRYLTVSYNVFMLGFVATVLTFLILLFLQ